MRKLYIAAAIFAIAAAPAVARQENEGATPPGETVEAADPAAAAIVADCSARKFETSVELEKNGQKRLTKLKLCAGQGADDTAWVRTLEDAKAKIASHPTISIESKAKIAVEFDAEIAKARTADVLSSSMPITPARPLPEPPSAAIPTLPAATIPIAAPIQVRPRLTIRCLTPGEVGDWSECTSLQRDTRLSIQADNDVAPGTSLRFLRRGDERGRIVLAGMRRGQLVRYNLPPKLCIGVASSKVEIQIMRLGQVFETLGPYQLRC